MRIIRTILFLAGVLTMAGGVDRYALGAVIMGSLSTTLGLNLVINAAIDKARKQPHVR
jgi:hypothetical protein